MENTIKENSDEFRNRLELLIGKEDPFPWASKIGLAGATMDGLWNKGAKPQKKTIQKIVYKTGVNEDWLMKGKGPMFLEGGVNPEPERPEIASTQIDAALMGEIVVTMERQFLNSPVSVLAMADFMTQHKDKMQAFVTSLQNPENTQDVVINKLISEVSMMWIRYAGTEAGVASYIYNKVVSISDSGRRTKAIQAEAKFFLSIRTNDFISQIK